MTFTASNGIRVKLTENHHLIIENEDGQYPATAAVGVHVDALREFFQHEANHKPWHDAKEGEVWVFTTDEGTFPAFVETRFGDDGPALTFDSSTTEYALTDSGITAARRIWPEEERP